MVRLLHNWGYWSIPIPIYGHAPHCTVAGMVRHLKTRLWLLPPLAVFGLYLGRVTTLWHRMAISLVCAFVKAIYTFLHVVNNPLTRAG